MRISDWSSDVCASDLSRRPADPGRQPLSFRGDQRRPAVRPEGGIRPAPRYPVGHGGAVRAGAEPRGVADPLSRRPYRDRIPGAGDGRARLMAYRIGRPAYADLFGPTTGDQVPLGDTHLLTEEIEQAPCRDKAG